MNKLKAFLVILATFAIASCGGGDGSLLGEATEPGEVPDAAMIELVASSATLNSSATGNTNVQIFATVLDENRAVVAGAVVAFSTDTGKVKGIQTITDDEGLAIAELNNGSDATNRTINVTATANGISNTIGIQVVGTSISVACPPALALGGEGDCSVDLTDFQGQSIDADVTVSSAQGNTLSATTIQTGGGPVVVTVTADNPGDDTITVSGLGEQDSADISVSGDVFAMQAPFKGKELQLNTVANATVLWTKDGAPQVGESIIFSITRGTLPGGNTALTDGTGSATVQVQSASAGPATITAVNPELASASVMIEFVATTPDVLDLQANPLTVGVAKQTTITATIRDIDGNAVKNKIIAFNIEQDTTGNSFLSAGLAVTDTQGRATTTYTAGGVPSAKNGVVIRATVQDDPGAGVTNTVALTVAERAVDTSIGTGNTLFEPTTSLFAKEWAIIVTDTSGTAPEPVANTNVQASIRSVRYHKGFLTLDDVDPTVGIDLDWVIASDVGPPVVRGYVASCDDEDTNLDGFLDLLLEDARPFGNENGSMEAGNRATLTALTPGADTDACGQIGGLGGPTTVVQTDDNGIARVCVVYPQSDNLWVDVEITALLSVFGTEYSESRQFNLDASSLDIDDETTPPPGLVSPFGVVADWDDPNDVPDAGIIPACQHTN